MDTWLENNNRYLEASLQWLRLRLQRLLPEESAPAQTEAEGSSKRSRFTPWRSQGTSAQPAVKLLAQGMSASIEQLIIEAAGLRDETSRVDPPPAL